MSGEYYIMKTLLALPEGIRRGLFREQDFNLRGSPIDPHTRTLLALLKKQGRPSLDEIGKAKGVNAARIAYQKLYEIGGHQGKKAKVDYQDISVAGAAGDLRARYYTPHDKTSDGLLVYIHGGGFTIGDIEAYDYFNRYMCAYLGADILFPEYRMGPEYPFPAAVEDASAVVLALPALAEKLGFDADKVVVGGESAGGLLTVTSAHDAVTNGVSLSGIWVMCASLDSTQEYASTKDFGEGFGLSTSMMEWFFSNYIPEGQDLSDPRISPILLPELGRLPDTLLRICEYDPLADQSVAFAEKLRNAGVVPELRVAKGLLHGCANMFSVIPAAKRALDDDLDWVKSRL